MCFGKSKNTLYDDEPPRPAPGQAPQQPIYAPDPSPKASMPPQYHHQSQAQPQAQYQPPPPQHQQQQQPPPPAELSGTSAPPVELSASDDFAPPPGPPPSSRPNHDHSDDYAPPSGPPPSHRPPQAHDDFAPPSGPPPSRLPNQHQAQDDYAPPPGPPPPPQITKLDYDAPPPAHLHPTPSPPTTGSRFFSGFDRSPASNAPEHEAEAGEEWCMQHPLMAPLALDAGAQHLLQTHNTRLMPPSTGYRGTLEWTAHGVWAGRTDPSASDSCIIGYPPLYAVTQHSPLANAGRPKTIYYEVILPQDGNRGDVCLALGFTALPYPSFRMPGWHRASLAVHGDDGHRFVNDRWGGKTFTAPFRRGETVGIGMTFTGVEGRVVTDVFFTRQGKEVGRWNLHEEVDAHQDLPVTGLEGYHDLSCAIGTYSAVGFSVIFDPARWAYKPPVA